LLIIEHNSTTMKKSILFLAGFCLLFNSTFAQAPSAAFAPIKDHLERWDDIRGAWLALAVQALAANKQVPDRTFPEDFTPYEMLSMIPAKERQDLRQMVLENQRVAAAGSSTTDFGLFTSMLEHTFCSRTYGRSYGDPHLKSYDRATYSFQTVGEFVLSKSTNGLFEVQTRQRAQDDNFSLNAAVAMNVAGDRLCFYAGDKPDDILQTPLRLNGQAIQLQGRSYYLPHGGVVRLDGRNYTIAWPTGETTVVDVRSSGSRGFVNVTVGIFDCDRNMYEGLLGNNNGFADDDFNSRTNMPRPNNIAALSLASAYSFDGREAAQFNNLAEQEFQAYLAKNFAEDWRVTDLTTLFDYRPGTTTASYTDRSFPRIYMNVSQMNAQSREQARQRCLQMGVPSDEMGGCIFDQGYLNIPPNVPPTPNVPAPTTTVLNKLERPALNNNAHTFAEGKYPTDRPQTISTKPEGTTEKPSKGATEPNQTTTVPDRGAKEPFAPIESKPTTPAFSKPSAPVAPRPSAPINPRPRTPASSAPRPSAPVTPKPSVPTIKGKG
jgi:hypothetical protein